MTASVGIDIVDNGISKTVALPKDTTVEDIEKKFLMAHELDCKVFQFTDLEQVGASYLSKFLKGRADYFE